MKTQLNPLSLVSFAGKTTAPKSATPLFGLSLNTLTPLQQDTLQFSGNNSGRPAQSVPVYKVEQPPMAAATRKQNRDELGKLMDKLPQHIKRAIKDMSEADQEQIQELYFELGKRPGIKLANEPEKRQLNTDAMSETMLNEMLKSFGGFEAFNAVTKNRTGIDGTLHRISIIKDTTDKKVMGFTIRRGQEFDPIFPKELKQVLLSNNNILILGRPGVGKTTLLRALANMLSQTERNDDDQVAHYAKRTIVIDRSLEIAGGGDIPHSSVGDSTRMQVPYNKTPASVMIEAVENHNPDIIIADELGTREEADASKTIAERGVQLIVTAHGLTIENLIKNPSINGLIGGVKNVTIGDQMAQQRAGLGNKMQKEILQQIEPSKFQYILVFEGRGKVAVYNNVDEMVQKYLDSLLDGNIQAKGKEIQPAFRVEY